MDIPLFSLFVILILVIFNGVFAMSEIAIVSARKVRLQQRADAGDAAAQTALELSSNPGRFLSSVQIGITLIGILAGAYGEDAIADTLVPAFASIAWLEPYADLLSLTITVLFITYLSLVIGELVPKQIALSNAEGVAALVARPMKFLARVTSPIVSLLSFSSMLILRVLGIRPTEEPDVTEEEIKILISQGAETGVFEPKEKELVGRVFRLANLRAYAIATPRTEIDWLDIEDSVEEIRAIILNTEYTHYPVAEGDLDNLLGVVRSSDLLEQSLSGQALDLRSLIQPAVVVPESISAFDLLERFRETRQQFALVIDEFGGIMGLVTTRDLLESLVGDLPARDELEEGEVVQRTDGSYLVDGMMDVDRFKELFDLRTLPEEEKAYYQTLGGMVMTFLERVPSTGDMFVWEGIKVEVADMDGKRVDKVIITRLDQAK
jgi:putative hemolysin